MKMGRPSKYKPEYCEMIIEHMAKGLSIESFAGVVGVCEDTLNEWSKQYPEFKEARAIGKPKSRLFWEKLAIDNILNENFGNGQGSKSLNTGIWCANMKNRFQWRDKHPDEEKKMLTVVTKLQKEDLKELSQAARKNKKK